MDDFDLSKIPEDQLDAVISQLETLAVKSPLDYTPHDKQRKFHCSTKRIRLLSGGNQSGKTVAGANEALFHATGLYPDWYPQEMRIPGPNRGRIIGEDYNKWGEVLEAKLFEWLPKGLIIHVRRTMKGAVERVIVKHVSGGQSVFDVMTHEQDDGVFESWTGNWAWFDEPPPFEKWIATKRGLLALGGRAWFTMTPIKEPWIYDEFILNDNPDVFAINVDIRDNPHLTEENIKFFERDLPDDVKEARLHGTFKHLSGRVYKEFDKDIHVISESHVKINSNWPVYFVCDPHDRKPHHAIWARVDPMGTIYIVDSIQFKGTIRDFSREVLKREYTNHIRSNEVVRIGDPNKMKTPSAMNGRTFVQEFGANALYFNVNVNDDLTLGHLSVSQKLSWDKTKPISSTNFPKLFFIKEHTVEVVHQLLTYVWDDYRGVTKDSKGMKELPKDVNKDFPDCIRYLVMFNPGFFDTNEPDPSPVGGEGVTGYRR